MASVISVACSHLWHRDPAIKGQNSNKCRQTFRAIDTDRSRPPHGWSKCRHAQISGLWRKVVAYRVTGGTTVLLFLVRGAFEPCFTRLHERRKFVMFPNSFHHFWHVCGFMWILYNWRYDWWRVGPSELNLIETYKYSLQGWLMDWVWSSCFEFKNIAIIPSEKD